MHCLGEKQRTKKVHHANYLHGSTHECARTDTNRALTRLVLLSRHRIFALQSASRSTNVRSMLVMLTVAHDDDPLQLGIADLGNCLPLIEKGRSIVIEEVVQLLPIPLPLLIKRLICFCGGFVFAWLVNESVIVLWTSRKQPVIDL